MYGYQAIVDTINNEKATGYNSFGGESIFNNPDSVKSRNEYVQTMLDDLRRGDWNGYNASQIFGSKVQPALSPTPRSRIWASRSCRLSRPVRR